MPSTCTASPGPPESMRDRPRVLQCTNCWDYHNTRACRGLAKCRMCGSETCDRPGSCGNHTKCAVCHGPHPADDGKCPLRPSIKHGAVARPTRNQRTAVRRANDRAREAMHQAATRVLANAGRAGQPRTSFICHGPSRDRCHRCGLKPQPRR